MCVVEGRGNGGSFICGILCVVSLSCDGGDHHHEGTVMYLRCMLGDCSRGARDTPGECKGILREPASNYDKMKL